MLKYLILWIWIFESQKIGWIGVSEVRLKNSCVIGIEIVSQRILNIGNVFNSGNRNRIILLSSHIPIDSVKYLVVKVNFDWPLHSWMQVGSRCRYEYSNCFPRLVYTIGLHHIPFVGERIEAYFTLLLLSYTNLWLTTPYTSLMKH